MPKALDCLHMNHINAMVEDFEKGVGHLLDLYGAQFNRDLPGHHWHACLITVGGVMFEVFAPSEYLLHARFGPHYVGIEYQVPDADEARAEVLARGMRVIRELGVAIHVHPAEAFGVAWEFFGRSFHEDPPPVQYREPLKPSDYWREHPLGYTGLKRYSVAVSDLEAPPSSSRASSGRPSCMRTRVQLSQPEPSASLSVTPWPSSSARSGRALSSGTWPATVTASALPCSRSAIWTRHGATSPDAA